MNLRQRSARQGGVDLLHFTDEPDRESRRKTESEKPVATDGAPRPRARSKQPGDVGNALKTVYQRTIDEEIPPEMLDLLGKLG
jgi:hypothetical protein